MLRNCLLAIAFMKGLLACLPITKILHFVTVSTTYPCPVHFVVNGNPYPGIALVFKNQSCGCNYHIQSVFANTLQIPAKVTLGLVCISPGQSPNSCLLPYDLKKQGLRGSALLAVLHTPFGPRCNSVINSVNNKSRCQHCELCTLT